MLFVKVPTIGKHLILEASFKGDTEKLKDKNFLYRLFREVLEKSGVTIFGFLDKDFSGDGVSGVFLLGESHFSYHTWPDENYVSMDFYVCGNSFSETNFLKEVWKNFIVFDALTLERGIKSGRAFKIKRT